MNAPSITEVCYHPVRPNEKGFLGTASLLFNNQLSLNAISIYSTRTGDIRLLFPDRQLLNGKVINVFYPIDKSTYELMREAVNRKIQDVIENANGAKYHEKRVF